MARAPAKVNTANIKERVDIFVEHILASEVRPRLQYLIDKAQAKTKYPVYWYMGMGTACMHCAAPWERGSWDTIDYATPDGLPDPNYAERVERLKKTFPELVEFVTVLSELNEQGLICEDIKPTVEPRKDDGTQDPADYVELGPVLACQEPGCPATGTEGDFITGNDDVRRCDVCANKPENREHYARRNRPKTPARQEEPDG
jgi:hypothetical protein